MFGLGGQELIIVLVLVLVLFGGRKIPEMMRGLGEGMREFKKASNEDDDTVTTRGTTPDSTSNTTPRA
jgi:sec-independent protein translocase protein TatA